MAQARTRSRFIQEAIAAYASDHTSPPDDVQLELQRVTQERTGPAARMQIGDDQAVFMEIMARSMERAAGSRSVRSPATRHSHSRKGWVPRGDCSAVT